MAEPAWWCLWPPTSSLSTTMSHDLLWPSQYCDLITSVDNATLFCASQVRFGSHRCKKGPICIIMFPAKLHGLFSFRIVQNFWKFWCSKTPQSCDGYHSLSAMSCFSRKEKCKPVFVTSQFRKTKIRIKSLHSSVKSQSISVLNHDRTYAHYSKSCADVLACFHTFSGID